MSHAPDDHPDKIKRERRWKAITFVVTLPAAVVALAIIFNGVNGSTSAGPRPSATEATPSPSPPSPSPPPPSVSPKPVVLPRYLDNLEMVGMEGSGLTNWEVKPAAINGQIYAHALVDLDAYSGSSVTYNLGRDYTSFTSTAGVLDSSGPDSAVRIEVYRDEKLALSVDGGVGAPVPIELDVTGTLRLKLVVINIAPDLQRRPSAGFGEPKVF